jgi:2-C-methyl-D-erythritol 4-phosphate cytidylyltransferase
VTTWAIVVAAGSGTRFGRVKQLERLGDRRVLDWSVAAAASCADGVVVVTADGSLPAAGSEASEPAPPVQVVCGGETRSASVRAGLAAVPRDADIIVVHDAARPLASPQLFDQVVQAVREGADAVVPGVAVVDTVRRRSGGVVDRDELVAVQTPQAFRGSILRAAHASGSDATDDATLVESLGGVVVVIAGEPENRKITTPADLVIAEALVRARSDAPRREGVR